MRHYTASHTNDDNDDEGRGGGGGVRVEERHSAI